ncbi:MAG: Na/Pi cotransporter family protein [Oligoflexia bacterium]|nr:Na/Pi cotransporter family protein [Oligoflexia bacterium]
MALYQHLILLFAGICFFMYGMQVASLNLQIIAADRVRFFMSKLAERQFIGILSGIGLTVLLQSSSAVTVMLVNLASAGVVTLTQVMGVIIGTAVGTTITVQLISFNVTAIALYIVILGFLILFLSKSKKAQEVGTIIFGFGLIFYGLLMMGEAVSVVKDIQGFKELFKYLNENPLVAFALSTLLTAFVHSSAVTIGLAMTLATNGVITLYDSMFWMYGANLGTTATALMASLGGSYAGRQVAIAHFFYKAISVLAILFFTTPFVVLVSATAGDATHQIANAHTIFNIASALLFYPFINWGARFIEKLFPRPHSEKEFGAKYLDAKSFSSPPMAFANAIREMLRMADYALEMVRLSPQAFEKDDPDFTEELKKIDKKIDTLNKEIKLYLVRLTDEKLTEIQNGRVVNLIALVSDIENIGDVVDKNILALAKKKSTLKVTFSEQGWIEVREFHRLVVENFELAISAFSLNNQELAEKVIRNKHNLRMQEQKLRETHIQRLSRKMQDSVNTSNIHMDLLSALRRVNSYACNLVYPVLNAHAKGLFPPDDTNGSKDSF